MTGTMQPYSGEQWRNALEYQMAMEGRDELRQMRKGTQRRRFHCRFPNVKRAFSWSFETFCWRVAHGLTTLYDARKIRWYVRRLQMTPQRESVFEFVGQYMGNQK